MFKYYLYKFGQFLIRRLSLKSAYRFAMSVSVLQSYFSPRDFRAVKNNLRIITGQTQNLDLMARQVFKNFGKYLVEFFRMANEIDEKFIREKIKMVNPQYLQEAMAHGKGVILLTAHIGSWELGGLVLGMTGHPVLAIALPHKERPVNDLFNKQRELRGVTIVPINQAVHRCLSALKNNKLIAVLADRDFTNNGEMMKFLGRDVQMPKGAAMFAYKTGAVILPIFLLRNEDDTFSLQFEKPICPPRIIHGQIGREDLLFLMKQYVNVIEEKIRQYPTQWLMFREFWDPKSNIINYSFSETQSTAIAGDEKEAS